MERSKTVREEVPVLWTVDLGVASTLREVMEVRLLQGLLEAVEVEGRRPRSRFRERVEEEVLGHGSVAVVGHSSVP